MYIRTLPTIYLGEPPKEPPKAQPALQTTFASKVITFKDAKATCQSTNCALFVPSSLRDQPKLDVLVFFHGLDTCSPKYKSDPQNVINNFKLADQVNKAARKAALVVPLVKFTSSDRDLGFIRSAWSAAYLNSLVEEVLDQIGKSSRVRPSLDRLILAGHSAGFEILIPLAEQFVCGQPETKKGALAKLGRVIAFDIPHISRHVDALVDWARAVPSVQFTLVFANDGGTPPTVWNAWRARNRTVKLPSNLIEQKPAHGHCQLPPNHLTF
jgi:hypothetical protein